MTQQEVLWLMQSLNWKSSSCVRGPREAPRQPAFGAKHEDGQIDPKQINISLHFPFIKDTC